MTNQEDRIGKLDELYDQACAALEQWMTGEDHTYDVDPSTSFGIIDRWLAVREADRQYELAERRESRERSTVRPL